MREIRLLLAELLGKTYEEIYLQPELSLTNKQQEIFGNWIKRRAAGEPLAKILQRKDFWEHSFKTTAATLDPRPESECIIEAVLEQKTNKDEDLKILDLGTGTGCLLLSLLYEYPNAYGVGVDLSLAACQIAQANLTNLGFAERGIIVNSSWFEAIRGQCFDVIVANPPYISINDSVSEGAKFDPDEALYADDQGIEHYKHFAKKASTYLKSNGIIVVEHGYWQHDLIVSLFEDHGYDLLKCTLDINKIKRTATFACLG